LGVFENKICTSRSYDNFISVDIVKEEEEEGEKNQMPWATH
jgi:hypothetical protein